MLLSLVTAVQAAADDGADVFRQTGFVRPNRLKLLTVAAAWFLVSPVVVGPATVLVPGYLI